MDGQKLEDKQLQALETLPQDAPFMTKMLVKHRRIIGIEIEQNQRWKRDFPDFLHVFLTADEPF